MSNQASDQRPWATTWLKHPLKHSWNGMFSQGTGTKLMQVADPFTGEVIAQYQAATVADVEAAAQAAKNAFKSWTTVARRDRAKLMLQIANVIRDHAAELATLETLCNGKLYQESLYDDLPESAEVFEYYAGWVDKHYGETCPVAEGFLNYTLREPVGVCGLVVPWNFPLLLACWKIAPALAMGNTIVVKPSEYTPLTLVRLLEIIIQKTELPRGVINLVLGDAQTGKALSSSSLIDKVSFTGSTEVGRLILKQSAESNLKRVTLELGGKSPNIIFADAPDLEAAIERSFTAMFSHKGEKCSEPTRLLVEKSVYEKVLKGLELRAKSVVCGDPFDPRTTQGPQCHRQHYEKVLSYIEIGKAEGLRLIAGGTPESTRSKSLCIPPTIFADVPPSSKLSREEIFGPVLVVTPFVSEDEAIQMANDTSYGLAAGLWTRDISRAHRAAAKLEAGMVFINRYGCYDFSSPFGGVKQSGWGHEMAIHSLDSYTKLKSVWVKL
jgi:aldehyde dehydrogenase (NAD+)